MSAPSPSTAAFGAMRWHKDYHLDRHRRGLDVRDSYIDELEASLDARDAEIEILCGKMARTRYQTVMAFAEFLHSMPAEDGWDVGPARVKYSARGAIEGGPLWATIEDTERWAHAFLQGSAA